MNSSNYRFTLDMQSNISQVSLPVRLGDTSRKLYINLTDSGSPYFIEDGCLAVFSGRKADDNKLFNNCVIEKNTTIVYKLTEQTTSFAGVVDCEIRLYGTQGELITSPRFILVVDERVVSESDESTLIESMEESTTLDEIALSENARIEAENERVSAEEFRQTRFDSLMESADKRISQVMLDVENASGRAQEAVTDAEEALAKVNSAVSPTVSVTEISGGHRVNITDVNGTKSFDVMDGEDGEVVGGTKIAVGSYVGTGGTSKKLTFGFTPKVVIVQAKANQYGTGLFLYGSGVVYNLNFAATGRVVANTAAWAETTLTIGVDTGAINLSSTSSVSKAIAAFNYTDNAYNYVAIG